MQEVGFLVIPSRKYMLHDEGLQLPAKISKNGLVSVSNLELFVDDERNKEAVDMALEPLVDKVGIAAGTLR